MLRFVQVIVLLLAVMAATSPDARAEKRIALLIGNQSYSPELGKLANPHNDVALLERTLKTLRFEVVTIRDASLGALHQAVNAHARRVRAAGPKAIAFFYYAGHGAADAGTNYLIPVDVKSAEQGVLWDVSLRLTEVTRKLKTEAGNATHFVVFDACRNNLKLRAVGSRALVQSRGFEAVPHEIGMLVAYATAEGELASDVGASAGPYALALAEEIIKPGVEAVTMFRNVQRRVRATIKQEPYLGFNALGDVFLAGLAPPEPAKPPPAAAKLGEATQAWDRTKDTQSIAALEAFIRRFGDTYYGDLAKARLDELQQAEVAKQAEVARKKAEDEERAKKRVALAPPPGAPATRCDGIEVSVGIGQEKRCIRPGSGQSFKDCTECPDMVVVPAGNFIMGSPDNEEGRRDNEGPQRTITIAKPFAVGRFEVAFSEWDACAKVGGCKYRPDDDGWGRGRRPVINVSWKDVTEQFLPWLSLKTGKAYRLLSEAEWEYAARAGTTTPFSTGSTITTEQANFEGIWSYGKGAKGVSRRKTVSLGLFRPNAFGLYDMHGNALEWVNDCFEEHYAPWPLDGSAVPDVEGCTRVTRGGSWSNMPQFLRSAKRDSHPPSTRLHNIGFRLARTLE